MNLGEAGLEAAAISTSGKLTAGGGAVGFVGWLSQVNWIGWAGVVIAVLGLAVNAYFQWRRDLRESAESEARIEVLRSGGQK